MGFRGKLARAKRSLWGGRWADPTVYWIGLAPGKPAGGKLETVTEIIGLRYPSLALLTENMPLSVVGYHPDLDKHHALPQNRVTSVPG